MTAQAANGTLYYHPTPGATRRPPLKVLRGAHIYQNSLVVLHNDRMMPYPTGGFRDNSKTVAQGGPLTVAGADANGGVMFIAKKPKVRVALTNNATTAVTVLPDTPDIAITADVTAVTAQTLVNFLRKDAQVMDLVDVHFTGTGGGLIAATGATAVPHVRWGGFSPVEIDNSSDTSNDLTVTDSTFYLDTGRAFVSNDATDPCSVSDVDSPVFFIDSQTVQRAPARMYLSATLFDFTALRGPCVSIP